MGKLSNAKKLTKTEQYAIEGMVSNGMYVSEIAKSLSRDVDLVSEYVSSIEEPEKKEHKSKGLAVMTEATSQRIDRMRNTIPKKTRDAAIHKIK